MWEKITCTQGTVLTHLLTSSLSMSLPIIYQIQVYKLPGVVNQTFGNQTQANSIQSLD